MASHKSAEKRHRQTLTRTVRARALRTRVRTVLKDARQAVASGAADAAKLVAEATSLLDRAGSKNVFPPNRVARIKSRLAIALARTAKAA